MSDMFDKLPQDTVCQVLCWKTCQNIMSEVMPDSLPQDLSDIVISRLQRRMPDMSFEDMLDILSENM